MKLLIDQNISFRTLYHLFIKDGWVWQHVKDVSLTEASDQEIWNYTRSVQIDCIVTADQDFYQLLLINGIPPKVIWLRIGNGSYQRIANFINSNQSQIEKFLADPFSECLEIWSYIRKAILDSSKLINYLKTQEGKK